MKCINCSNEIELDQTTKKYKCKSCGTELSKGDIVHHKTNDRVFMMVSRISSFGVVCKWIDTTGCYHKDDFELFELELDKFKDK